MRRWGQCCIDRKTYCADAVAMKPAAAKSLNMVKRYQWVDRSSYKTEQGATVCVKSVGTRDFNRRCRRDSCRERFMSAVAERDGWSRWRRDDFREKQRFVSSIATLYTYQPTTHVTVVAIMTVLPLTRHLFARKESCRTLIRDPCSTQLSSVSKVGPCPGSSAVSVGL